MKVLILKSLTLIFYLGVLVVNYLANSLPLNNQSTGAISDKYPTYFTPSGFTFAIWGIIYLLLGVFVFQILLKPGVEIENTYNIAIVLFVLSCVFNITWLIAWHYDKILLSTIIMICFLVTLIFLNKQIMPTDTLIKVTFSTYLGWICVALIANISILITKSQSAFFLNNSALFYYIIIFIGVLLVGSVLFFDKNIIFAFVFIWAYFGILMKHISQEGKYLTNTAGIWYTGILLFSIISLTTYTFIANDFKLFD